MNHDDARQVVEGYLDGHRPEWLSEQVVFHDMTRPEPMRGRAEVTGFLHRFYEDLFSGGRVEHVRLTAGAGRVVAEWVFHGRHSGSVMGESPTGRDVEIPMACAYEVAAGEITAARLYYDQATLLRQIGAATAGAGA